MANYVTHGAEKHTRNEKEKGEKIPTVKGLGFLFVCFLKQKIKFLVEVDLKGQTYREH